jgi:hypothetical protein
MKNAAISLYLICFLALYGALLAAETKSEFVLANGVKISIVEDIFDATKHDIKKCKNDFFICYIDENEPFGASWGTPKTYIKNITVTYQGEVYKLDSSNMYNAWGHRLEHAPYSSYFMGECKDKYNCTFRGMFSDAGTAFMAEWKIINGESLRTVMGYYMEIDFLNLDRVLSVYKDTPIEINPKETNGTVKINLSNGIAVSVIKNSFDKKAFKIKKCNHIDAICLINERVPFGTSRVSYEIPKTYMSNIIVTYKGIDYNLDTSDMYDADISNFGGTCNEEIGYCFFRGIFLGKGENFVAQWGLDFNNQWGGSKRSVLTSGRDIIDEFLKNIDANVFFE